MSVSKWNYDPDRCDGHYCPGDCWWCKRSPDHDGDVDDMDLMRAEAEDG